MVQYSINIGRYLYNTMIQTISITTKHDNNNTNNNNNDNDNNDNNNNNNDDDNTNNDNTNDQLHAVTSSSPAPSS